MEKEKTDDGQSPLYVVPNEKEQTPMGSRVLEQKLLLPLPFLQLCKLLRITPAKILTDFMDALSHDFIVHQNDGEPHRILVEYFISMGYGQNKYSEDEIRRMFREFRAISDLWPFGADEVFIDEFSRWREGYMNYWLEKWQRNAH